MKEYQNITLALPREILIKVKHIAIDRQMSVTKLVSNVLEDIVSREDSYKKAKKHYMEFISDHSQLNTGGTIQWKRDELHER